MPALDAHSLQELMDAHAAPLALYARQWCRAPEDAVQEALVELLRVQSMPDNVVGWLYAAVRRRAMNLARGEQRRTRHQQAAGRLRDPWFVAEPGSAGESPDWESLLARLPRLEREIVIARTWSELTFAQIAELVEQPLSTVHRRYQRALAALADELSEPTQVESRR